MTIDTLQKLYAERSYPSISISMVTHRRMPERAQDHAHLKHLVQTLEQPVLAKLLHDQITHINFEETHDGLVLLANTQGAHVFILNHRPHERVMVSDRFLMRELVREALGSPRCWILVLSTGDKPTGACRLFEIDGAHCGEIIEPELDTLGQSRDGFPYWRRNPESREMFSEGSGDRNAHYEDERLRNFFIQVEHLLSPFRARDNRPLFVVGLEQELAFGWKHSALLHTGDYVRADLKEICTLGEKLWAQYQEELREKVLAGVDQARGESRFLFGVREVWRAAAEGRILKLLVDEQISALGKEDPNLPTHCLFYDDSHEQGVFDLVDDIIMTTLDKRGDVTFFPAGSLKEYEGIAAILRY